MKKLNQKSAQVFTKIVELLNGERHIKIQSSGFMDLCVNRLDTDIQTPFGKVTVYSLAHYYEQDGDLMSDPDMTFIYQDLRTPENMDWELLRILPQSFTNSSTGTYDEAIDLENNRLYPHILSSLCSFANFWFANISQQGFLSKGAVIVHDDDF